VISVPPLTLEEGQVVLQQIGSFKGTTEKIRNLLLEQCGPSPPNNNRRRQEIESATEERVFQLYISAAITVPGQLLAGSRAATAGDLDWEDQRFRGFKAHVSEQRTTNESFRAPREQPPCGFWSYSATPKNGKSLDCKVGDKA
jgi:hypothetical protein